jgi:hypothetical protein
VIFAHAQIPFRGLRDARNRSGDRRWTPKGLRPLPLFGPRRPRRPPPWRLRLSPTIWPRPASVPRTLRPLEDTLLSWMVTWVPQCTEVTLSTLELYQKLDKHSDNSLSRHKVSSGPKHLGRQLNEMSRQAAWRNRLSRTSRRLGGREKNAKQACWRILRSDPYGLG